MAVDGVTRGAWPLARRTPWCAAAVAVLGAVYALAVPAGLPYDEPSHWLNVLYIADGNGLPRVGAPGLTYEAVQAPLVYLIDGGVAAVLQTLGASERAVFFAVRLVHVMWLVALVPLLCTFLSQVAPRLGRSAQAAGALLVGSAPVVVAVGSSIQNDVPALVLLTGALVAMTRREGVVGARTGAITGLLLGLAFLAKASIWPVGVVVVAAMVVRRRWAQAGAAVLVGAAISIWWVIRNISLYGSLTGTNAVDATGLDFPPLGFHGVSTGVDLSRNALTFLWSPVEYWRNVVASPAWVDLLVIISTAALVAAALRRRRPTADQVVVIAIAMVSVVVWAVVTVAVANASFRLAYPALLLWAWVAASAARRVERAGAPHADRRQSAAFVVLAPSALLHVWVALAILAPGQSSFITFG